MKTLIEIRREARQILIQLRNEAEKIHPKLISPLEEKDFFDPSLFDDTLREKFGKLHKQISYQNDYIWNLAREYFENIATDLRYNNVDIGYNNNGEPLTIPIDYSTYEPSMHLKKIYNAVLEFKNFVCFQPFWTKQISLHLNDSQQWVQIYSSHTPCSYIKNANEAITNSAVLKKNELLIIAIKTEIRCDYEMHKPKYKNPYRDTNEMTGYINNVLEHKLLEELLKNEPGNYSIQEIKYTTDEITVKVQKDVN